MRAFIELDPGNIELYLDRLLAIEQEAFAEPWSREAYLEEARRPIAHLLGLVETGKGGKTPELLAYAGFWQVLDEADINNVAVATEHRGQGLGRELVRGLLAFIWALGCRQVNLEVRRSNRRAIGLYESCGFTVVGCRGGYYSDGEDALLMQAEAH